MTHIAPADAAEWETAPTAAAVATNHPVPSDPSADVDADAVAEAAEDFECGNVEDVARLAEAAAAQGGVGIERTLHGMVAETDAGTVAVDRSGVATLSADGMPKIGITVEGDPDTVKIVDGAVIQEDLKTLMNKGKDLVFDLLGVGSCIALLTTK
jgi:hypothetical protein